MYINIPYIKVPLSTQAHEIALRFAAEQLTVEKGKKIYLNTLAVYTVHYYLKWFGIKTDLNSGECWHPGLRCLFDIADLVIPNVGKLECRRVLPGESRISLPTEVTIDRIGYVAVQFNEYLNQVQLLGFVRAIDVADSEEISITDFQPLDTLLDYLRSHILQSARLTTPSMPINISQWFENNFTDGWSPTEVLYAGQANQPSVRSIQPLIVDESNLTSGISGGKLIDLGIQIYQHPLALVITVVPITGRERNVVVQVMPNRGGGILPQGVGLKVSDDTGTYSMDTSSRESDNWIQIEFTAELREQFSVEITFGEASLIQYFLI